MSSKTLLHYFPELSEQQLKQYEKLASLYREWNEKINVISRKDVDNLFTHHILHSLVIAKFVRFKKDSDILDLGTGGGLPGLPLAILFPDVNFHLVDARNKKIHVIQQIQEALDIRNVLATHGRVEDLAGKYDFIVTRAVAKMNTLRSWTRKRYKTQHQCAIPNGLIALKGGNISEELKELPKGSYTDVIPLSKYYGEPYFSEKVLVYYQA